jgi:hypothetical protein
MKAEDSKPQCHVVVTVNNSNGITTVVIPMEVIFESTVANYPYFGKYSYQQMLVTPTEADFLPQLQRVR